MLICFSFSTWPIPTPPSEDGNPGPAVSSCHHFWNHKWIFFSPLTNGCLTQESSWTLCSFIPVPLLNSVIWRSWSTVTMHQNHYRASQNTSGGVWLAVWVGGLDGLNKFPGEAALFPAAVLSVASLGDGCHCHHTPRNKDSTHSPSRCSIHFFFLVNCISRFFGALKKDSGWSFSARVSRCNRSLCTWVLNDLSGIHVDFSRKPFVFC